MNVLTRLISCRILTETATSTAGLPSAKSWIPGMSKSVNKLTTKEPAKMVEILIYGLNSLFYLVMLGFLVKFSVIS